MAAVQNAVVLVLVGSSVLLSVWWLLSARSRLRVLDQLVGASAARGPLAALRRSLLARAALGGCGTCKANPSADAQRSTQKAAGPRH